MPEPTLTLCPNCGRRVQVPAYQDAVICGSCKQEIRVQLPWNQARARPEPDPTPLPGAPPPPPARRSRGGLIALIIVAAAALGVGVVLLVLPRLRASPPPPPPDFFRDASPVPAQLARALGFPVMVQKLTLYPTRAEAEVWDSEQGTIVRHIVYASGELRQRSSGAARAAAFDLSEIDLSPVALMVADASGAAPAASPGEEEVATDLGLGVADQLEAAGAAEVPGASVHRVTLERQGGGSPRWQVHVDAPGGLRQVDYQLSGERVAPPR